MKDKYDVIIIGGGPAGVSAAFPLVEAGLEVLMLDGGLTSSDNFDKYQNMDFEEIRKNISAQHEIFLGNDLSGALPLKEKNQAGHMASGRFSYMTKKTEEFLPVNSGQFNFTQTLAKGGMTQVWGGASDVLDENELETLGLPAREMKEHYQKIIDRIGISGEAEGYKTQPPSELSTHARKILTRFSRHENYFEKSGIKMHPALLALLTEDKKNRKKTQYKDTDYWLENGRSLYRARYDIEELQTKNNFHYVSERVAVSISESNGQVSVKTLDFSKNEHIYIGRYAVLAAGALNTVRILLKSFNLYNQKIRMTSKPHIITPCLDLGFLGQAEDKKKHSLCQLMLESENKTKGLGNFSTQLYTYKSLLLFKLLDFSPLTLPESMGMLALWVPAMMIADSRFPAFLDEHKVCELDRNGVLRIEYQTEKEELSAIKNQMKIIKKSLRKLGLIPLKDIYMPEGSSAHYAGGVSTESDSSSPLKADINGKLAGSSNIFVADASLWQALSAKPPTLTIMANANRIGSRLAKL